MTDDSENAQTKPTLETVLNRINDLGENLQGQLNLMRSDIGELRSDVGELRSDVGELKADVSSLKSDVGSLKSDSTSLKTEMSSLRNEFQLFRGEMEIRIDRIEGMTNQTRAEMLNLRADFREWKDQLKESMA